MNTNSKDITLIMAYYENPQMLQMQYDHMRDLPADLKRRIKVIVVDDGSPNHPAVHRDVGIHVSIFRIDVDVRWNQDAARNIGVANCSTEWMLLTDMDHVVNAETWKWAIDWPLNVRNIYTFRRLKAPGMEEHKPHPNSWLISQSVFKRVWYDERFAGFYGTDGDFKLRAQQVASVVAVKAQLIVVPRELVPDASTTAYTRKEHYDYENIKRIRAERGSQPARRLTFPYRRIA